MALGFSDSLGGPGAKSQVVSAFATNDYYLGVFGLGHQATNISNFTDPQPTFLAVMKEKSLIPSLSWAYTAGAPYRKLIKVLPKYWRNRVKAPFCHIMFR